MQVIESDRVVLVDIDDTVILWDLSSFPKEKQIIVEGENGPVVLVPHEKNINTLIKFYKLGYTLIAWSGSSHRWAKAVLETLDLEKYFTLCLSKPRYYFDDKPAETWIGDRVWRDPNSGYEK